MNNINTETLQKVRKKVFDYKKNNKNSIEIGDVCFKLGNIHTQINDNSGALECFENALKIYKNCENGDLKCADCFKSFSSIYMKYDVDSSIRNLDLCINLYTKNLGQNCLENADCYFKKGICFQNQEKWQVAKETYNRSLDLYMKNIDDKEDIDVADCYFKLGKVNEMLENFAVALSYYQNSLNIYIKKLGNSHINIGNNYYNIGIIYENLSNFDLAIENFHNSNKIFFLINGENDEDYIDTFINIGSIYKKKQDLNETLNFYEKALDLCNTYGLKSDNELFTLHIDIACLYIDLKKVEKVSFHLTSCLNISQNDEQITLYLSDIVKKFIEKCGKDFTPDTHNNFLSHYLENLNKIKNENSFLADLLFSFGKSFSISELSIKAIEMFLKSINFYEKVQNSNQKPSQLKICDVYNYLGIEYDKIKNFEESFTCFNKTLKFRKKVLGSDHLKTAGAYNNVAIALDKMNRYVDALENWKKCMEIRLKKLDPNDIKIANSYFNLSIILFKMKDYDESIKYILKSLAIYNKKLGDDNLFSADASMNLGELYNVKNDFNSAELYLESANRIYCKKVKDFENNINYLKITSLLGCSYSRNNKYELCIKILSPIMKTVRLSFGENNSITLDSLYELGVCYEAVQDLENAYKMLNEINGNIVKNKWPDQKAKLLIKKLYQIVYKYVNF